MVSLHSNRALARTFAKSKSESCILILCQFYKNDIISLLLTFKFILFFLNWTLSLLFCLLSSLGMAAHMLWIWCFLGMAALMVWIWHFHFLWILQMTGCLPVYIWLVSDLVVLLLETMVCIAHLVSWFVVDFYNHSLLKGWRVTKLH